MVDKIILANTLLRQILEVRIQLVDRNGLLSLLINYDSRTWWRSLKVRNSERGLKLAIQKAIQLEEELLKGDSSFLSLSRSLPERSLAEWIRLAKKHYFDKNARTPQSETTWDGEYRKSFKKISGDRLTEQALLDAILSTEPDSRTRKRVVTACHYLAEIAGKNWDFSQYRGDYSHLSVNPRNLPADEDLLAWGDRIPNENWQWFYWMVVTYGVRPSENFFCYPSGNGNFSVIVEATKIKRNSVREAFPLHPRWPERFDLMRFKLPEITFRRPSEISERAGKYFSRFELPFTFTDLRHCWARRATELGLDEETAARSMGHSLTVHREIYKAWIGGQVYRQKFEELLQRLS
jgi:hypothetical protein